MSDYVSPDLLFRILKYLPVKSLLRCRCVCKLWKDVLGRKSFILDHLAVQSPRLIAFDLFQNLKLKHTVMDLQTLESVESVDDHFDDLTRLSYYLSVASTVHGVICLYNYSDILFLWNPSIRRLLRLGVPTICYAGYTDDTYRCCGFWIDPGLTNIFKIVIFLLKKSKFVLFSSVKQGWVEVDIECQHFRDTSFSLPYEKYPQVLILQVGHWSVYGEGPNGGENGFILWFDYVQGKLGTIEYPELKQVEYKDIVLIKWRDCLSFVHLHNDKFSFRCDLWAMQDGSWSKVVTVPAMPPIRYVLSVGEDYGWVVAMSDGRRDGGRVVVVDPKQGCVRRRSQMAVPWYFTCSCDFVETLVFPDLNSCYSCLISPSYNLLPQY